MTKLDQDNFPCTWSTWCISAVQISVFSRGDNCGISKDMKITRTALQGSIKLTSCIMCSFKGRFVCRTLGLDWCAVQKEGFRVIDSDR